MSPLFNPPVIPTAGTPATPVPITADGAISIPSVSTTYIFTKAGVASMTLADPTAGTHDGIRLTFIASVAAANIISNAAGSGFNVGGALGDVATFAGGIGDSLTIEAYQGKWYVVDKTNVVIA